MSKALVGLLGILLCGASIFYIRSLSAGEKKASALDNTKTVYGSVGGDILPCTWDVKFPERVMPENKSGSVLVEASSSADAACESTISLRAPSFDVSPNKEEQKINLPAGKKGSLSWILTPRKTGIYEISVSDILNTKIFGITVTNTFGLTAVQAQLASTVGGLFGPMLTLPWWWDRLRNHKQNSDSKKSDSQPAES